MEFIEKAKIMLQHWITHNDHHQEEFEGFANQLEGAGRTESAGYVREMIELNARGAECLKKALKELE